MERQLPFSRPADVAANREAHFSIRQLIGLVYSGVWRLLVGLPTTAVATVAGWNHDFWAMILGIGFAGAGLYLSWRGFSFFADAITRNVAFVTGPIQGYSSTYKGTTSYYVMVGPVHRRLRRKTYETLPHGLDCHAYYASGSQRLLSLEPATEAEPHPRLHFGGDAAQAWDRIRWPVIIAAVGAFGLAAGMHGIATAHPVQPYMVSGTINDYQEQTGRGAYRHLYLAGSSATYSLDYLDRYSPEVPFLRDYIGSEVDLYVNPDTNGGVIAVRLREQLYTDDYYRHHEDQTRDMIVSGALIASISLAGIIWGLRWQTRARRLRNARLHSYAVSRSKVTSIKGL